MTVDPTLSDELDHTLEEMELLHARETEVLRTMNSAALDELTVEKEALCERLREVHTRVALRPRHRAALDRLRRQASLNQLLVVHARDAIRTVLGQVTGASFDGLPGNRKLGGQEGLRLNVRG